MELGIHRLDVLLQDLGDHPAGLVPLIVDQSHGEPGSPDLALVAEFHLLGGLLHIVAIVEGRVVLVGPGKRLGDRTVSQVPSGLSQNFVNVGLILEGISEGPPTVGIVEELRGDTIFGQFPRADQVVALDVEVGGEEARGVHAQCGQMVLPDEARYIDDLG